MRKTSKRARRSGRQAPDRAATTDIVSQIECAIRHPQATLIGAFIGGMVPWFARTLAHDQVPATWSTGNYALVTVMLAVVLGCALFSALTVYKFGHAAFGDSRKALGFTLAIEGVMLVSSGTTSTAALAVLIAINALANGSVIALAREATCKRRAAVAKSAETRARRATNAPAVHVAVPPPVPQAARRAPATSRAMIKTSQWNPMMTDVIEAEIISEVYS